MGRNGDLEPILDVWQGMARPRDTGPGWVYGVDADTGAWKWRLKSNYPIVSGMTPTAGGVVFFGDLGGNFYALDASQRAEALGPGARRRDRRRRDHLYGRRCAKDCRGEPALRTPVGQPRSSPPRSSCWASIARPPRPSEEFAYGARSGFPIAAPVWLPDQLSYHLSGLHDRLGGVAGDDRGRAARHRQRALPARLRFLAQGVRGLVRHGCRNRHRDGVPVRHQLERAGAEDRLDPGAAPRLRNVYRLHVGSNVFRRHVARPRPRVAALLPLRLLHDLARDDVFIILEFLANNSWMQVPLGHTIVDGKIIPAGTGGPSLPDPSCGCAGRTCCSPPF